MTAYTRIDFRKCVCSHEAFDDTAVPLSLLKKLAQYLYCAKSNS